MLNCATARPGTTHPRATTTARVDADRRTPCMMPRLRDAQAQRLARRGLALFLHGPLVDLTERELVHVLALEEVGVPRVDRFYLLQHLAHDHADVLVVDLHALQPVDLLHLVQEVLLHRPRAFDPQDVVRVDGPFGETVPGAHPRSEEHTSE